MHAERTTMRTGRELVIHCQLSVHMAHLLLSLLQSHRAAPTGCGHIATSGSGHGGRGGIRALRHSVEYHGVPRRHLLLQRQNLRTGIRNRGSEAGRGGTWREERGGMEGGEGGEEVGQGGRDAGMHIQNISHVWAT